LLERYPTVGGDTKKGRLMKQATKMMASALVTTLVATGLALGSVSVVAKEVSVKTVPKQFQGAWYTKDSPYVENIADVGKYAQIYEPDAYKTLELVLIDANHLRVTVLVIPDMGVPEPLPKYKQTTAYELKGNKMYTVSKEDGKTYRFGPYTKVPSKYKPGTYYIDNGRIVPKR
jgi:hypothetical protein